MCWVLIQTILLRAWQILKVSRVGLSELLKGLVMTLLSTMRILPMHSRNYLSLRSLLRKTALFSCLELLETAIKGSGLLWVRSQLAWQIALFLPTKKVTMKIHTKSENKCSRESNEQKDLVKLMNSPSVVMRSQRRLLLLQKATQSSSLVWDTNNSVSKTAKSYRGMMLRWFEKSSRSS